MSEILDLKLELHHVKGYVSGGENYTDEEFRVRFPSIAAICEMEDGETETANLLARWLQKLKKS